MIDGEIDALIAPGAPIEQLGLQERVCEIFPPELLVPAPLSESESQRVRSLAIRSMRALEGAGLGRVDFLMERTTGEFFVNEINSLPGFTESSMYPRLWDASGVPYPTLVDRLIELALTRHREHSALESVYRRS